MTKKALKFFLWRARRLFGLLLLLTILRYVLRIVPTILNILSGFTSALTKLGVKNPRVHGIMMGTVTGLFLTALDWFFSIGRHGYLVALGMLLFMVFLLDAHAFEVVREQDKHEGLAQRLRRSFRDVLWVAPLASQAFAFLFGTERHLIQALVEFWTTKWDSIKGFFQWLMELGGL